MALPYAVMRSALFLPTGRRMRPGWLVLGGILASGCSSPYEPDTQFWPGDDQAAGSLGGLPLTSGGLPSGGSSSSAGSGGFGGSAASEMGGAFGTSGTFSSAGFGGSTLAGGASSFGGASPFGGTSSFGGASPFGGTSSFGGASGGSSTSGGTTSSSGCSLRVKVTTAAAGGRYAPRNIGAIWIGDQSGNFVRSLEVWAQRRASNLTQWNSATSKAGVPGSRVDIVSEATLPSHMAHTTSWNCQDFNKRAVPDGSYRVYFEMTDASVTGPNRFESFTKGPAAATSTPADNNNFKAIELSYTP
jgi:hypothetical protein